jgi:hypothetical protein
MLRNRCTIDIYSFGFVPGREWKQIEDVSCYSTFWGDINVRHEEFMGGIMKEGRGEDFHIARIGK